MTITSLEPTSREAIRPSGDTLDFVSPGTSKVVGRGRGVMLPDAWEPELVRIGRLTCQFGHRPARYAYMFGLFGAVVRGVSVRARDSDPRGPGMRAVA